MVDRGVLQTNDKFCNYKVSKSKTNYSKLPFVPPYEGGQKGKKKIC